MNILKVVSIIVLVIGAIIFAAGLLLYWLTNPISGWASALVMIGLLFLLGSIFMLAISLQYDIPPLDKRLKQ